MAVELLRFLAAQPLPYEVADTTDVLDSRVLVLAGHIKATFDPPPGGSVDAGERATVVEITRLGRLFLSTFPSL